MFYSLSPQFEDAAVVSPSLCLEGDKEMSEATFFRNDEISQWNNHLDDVDNKLMQRHKFVEFAEMVPHNRKDLTFFIFFKSNAEIEAYKRNGVLQEIMEFAYDELEKAGRGKKGEFRIDFEFDSKENIDANFRGCYDVRMH